MNRITEGRIVEKLVNSESTKDLISSPEPAGVGTGRKT